MSAASGSRPAPAPAWSLDVEAGDPVDILGRPYVFERVDADLAVTFRAPMGAEGGDFMVVDAEGRLRKPVVAEVLALMEEDDLVWRDKPLGKEARRHARNQQHDAKQAHAIDELSEFRSAITRRFDDNPWSKSDRSLRAFIKEALADPKISAMPGAWPACPATVRTWLNERGTEGCRKEKDGVSMTNRMPRIRSLAHPLEIVFYHGARTTNVRGSVQMNYDNYVAELVKISKGQPLKRGKFDFDTGAFTDEPANYAKPPKPYKPIPYNRFWRLCGELRSAAAYARQTTKQAEYQRYGGGGLGDLPTHVGALCWIDAKTIEKAFFVDDVTGIPIGLATMTIMEEHATKVVPGWDLCPGACNSSSILRTVLKANQVKQVPQHLLEVDPNLPYLRLRPTKIKFDNSTEAHGRTVEQNLTDGYIGTDFVGSMMPRDKNVMERILGTFQILLLEHQEDANYDIARMRLYGFDPEKQVLCSIQTGRRLLALAIMTYNVSRNRGLDRRQPALVWKQKLGARKLPVLKDVDEFRDNIGIVDKATMSSAGLEKFNRRYTAGALDMKRIVQDFERAGRKAVGDIAAQPRRGRNRDDRRRATYEVRIRYDEDDIGVIKVWNPHNPTGATWERFGCTNPDAHGTPLWLHQRCLELAEREAMDYLSPEGQSVVRARLFEEIANTDSQSAERERQTLGRALSDPNTRRVMSAYVEVVDEEVEQFGEVEPEEHRPARHGLSTGRRQEADIDTPRQKPSEPKEPVTMRRCGGATAHQAADRGKAPAGEQAKPPRPRNRNTMNDDRRDAPAHTKSADRPDQRARSRTRSNRLKWGDIF